MTADRLYPARHQEKERFSLSPPQSFLFPKGMNNSGSNLLLEFVPLRKISALSERLGELAQGSDAVPGL